MLKTVIRFALNHRFFIMGIALVTVVVGSIVGISLPIDVLPKLTRPRVVLVTECPGLSPEEVEQQVTYHLETAVNGATGIIAVRSTSEIGLSVVFAEFDWNVNVITARQIVQERISTVIGDLPQGVQPTMGPMSSLLGQIELVALWSEDGNTDDLELRTLADWVVKPRLKNITGISQVITMGGGRKQYHVLVDQHLMHLYDVDLAEIEQALTNSGRNASGGYIDQNERELLIRGMGRLHTIEDIEKIVIRAGEGRSLLVKDVARVEARARPKRGDSSVNGIPSVVITAQKQPGTDTRRLTTEINTAIDELRAALPDGVRLEPTYKQREFIDFAFNNIALALRDGALLVILVLFLFLLNARTTGITLTAIPLSLLTTAMIFKLMGLSINVMTLGGIAVALGELVDDAIVDVENIYRRLRENARSASPRPTLSVVYAASMEVRHAIIISTILVVVAFLPLFALGGLPRKLFTPLGIAYIVSILASTLVSLTVTPVLSYYLLNPAKTKAARDDGPLLRILKWLAAPVIKLSMNPNGLTVILCGAILSVIVSVVMGIKMGKELMPDFNEGAVQVNLIAEPGISLVASRQISRIADRQFSQLLASEANPDGPLEWFTCRTGRAEDDEHVMGVNISEYVMTLAPGNALTREELFAQLHAATESIPGVEIEVEQPIGHLIDHLLSGVTAQIAIKIFGDDLDVLRRAANEVKNAIADVPGIMPPIVESQRIIPQYRVELLPDRLAYYGMTTQFVNDFVETAMYGRKGSIVMNGDRKFDLIVRFDDRYRNDLRNLHRAPLELPDGRLVALGNVARVYEGGGPNTVYREGGRRRIVVRVNTLGRDLSGVVEDIRRNIDQEVKLPEGYFLAYGGDFEAQQQASRRILIVGAIALVLVFCVLYSAYPSASIVLQILLSLPTAFVGGIAALWLSGQIMSVSAMVGFISLGGIAARNGLLLVSSYLTRSESEGFNEATILRSSLERLAPVLMTALTTGLGLLPLVLGGHLQGREILLPIATVLVGGLISSTLCEFLLRPGLFLHFSESSVHRLLKQSPQQTADLFDKQAVSI